MVKGLNCGQNEEWYGGQDWLPCQHGRFKQLDDGQWINNTTFCNGIDNVCTSDILVTIPELILISPGVVRHNYPKGEAPLIPQVNLTNIFTADLCDSLSLSVCRDSKYEF